MTDVSHHSRELRRGASYTQPGVRDAVRTGLGFAAAGATFLFVAMVWIGTCTGSIAQAAGCAAPQRAMLALGAPAILLVGGLWSIVRSFRRREHRWAWQASGWTLLALMVLSAVLSLPSLPWQ